MIRKSSNFFTLEEQSYLAQFFRKHTCPVCYRMIVDRAGNRNQPGYLALELGSNISSSLALVLADLHQGILDHLDTLFAARWPQSTQEQRCLPLLVSYRLFIALLPLALQGDGEQQRAIVREMKAILYRYWEPIIGTQRPSEMLSHELPVSAEEQEQ